MILVRWLARTWSALSAPPPAPLPGPRALPSYARMGRYIAGGTALDPRTALLVREVAALTLAVAGEHFFNPATGVLGADARLATPAEPGVRRAAGSGVRNLW